MNRKTMIHKPATKKQEERTKSIIVVPSKIAPSHHPDDLEGIEETEITAEISVPTDGGWGWVVLFASFMCIFILDGIFFTFGSIYTDIIADMEIEATLVALINSISVALYFITGPITSALINRYGFRVCTMLGSIILSFGYFCSYFATSYETLFIFYGFISGFGGCLVAMSSSIVVGFYFERLRALALSIAGTGSSVGIMIMFSLNSYLVNMAGWRITTLIHSGIFGTIYFLAMAYRPLLSLSIAKATDDPTRTVTYLPSLAKVRTSQSRIKKEGIMPSAAERLFSAVSNANFPTAASVVEGGVAAQQPTTQAGPSSGHVSKLTLTARNPQSGMSRRQIQQVKSIMSRGSVVPDAKNVEVTVQLHSQEEQATSKKKWWAKLCRWEEHVKESRPMYRDDVFYDGRIEKLPVYQKSMMETAPEARTGLEYQMAVSRAVTTADLEERRGVFTTAVRRILATMMDPKLLKRYSFLTLCLAGFLAYVGLLIPYIFLPDRNRSAGIDEAHCSIFVSVIGMANAVGRLIGGILVSKLNPLILYQGSCFVAGVGVMAYNLSLNVPYQYFCCVIFGTFISCVTSLRSMILVDLYGLEKLTNATGMLLMFQGMGCLLGSPLSSILKTIFGYTVSFYMAGLVIFLAGVVSLPVRKMVKKENTPVQAKDVTNVAPKQNDKALRSK